VIYTSFSDRLSIRANLRIQRALDNPLYRLLFPNTRIEVKGGGRDADAGPIRSIGRESL
jgi:hypothetical protein